VVVSDIVEEWRVKRRGRDEREVEE